MKKITAFLTFLVLSLVTNAQLNYQWHKRIGAVSSNELIYNVVSDNAGNVYVCGKHGAAVSNDVNIDYASQIGGLNAFIAKFDPVGNVIWTKNFPVNTASNADMQISGLAIGNDGRVFFSGRQATGNGDIDPGPGVTNVYGGWGILGCLDKDGNFLWGGSLQNIPFIPRVEVQSNGDPVFACSFFNNSGTIDLDYGAANVGLSVSNTGVRYGVILLKYSAAGAYQSYMWPTTTPPQLTPLIKGLPTNYSEDAIVSDFEIDNTGNYFVSVNMPWYSGNIYSGKEMIILKWNSAGVYENIAASTNTLLSSFNIENIATDVNGNIYGVGTMVGSMDFDPGTGTATLNACFNSTTAAFVWKLDGNLNYLNAIKVQNNTPCASITAGEKSNAFDISINGNDIFVVGNWIGTIDFDPGAGVQNVVSAGYDQYLLKLNNNLAYQNVHTFGGALTTGVEYPRAVHVNSSKEIIVGSMFDDNITDLDPQTGVVGVSLIGAQDALLTKFYECGVDQVIITQPSTQTVCVGNSATYSVAASGTATTYQWKKDGVDIVGANSYILTLANVTSVNIANYTVVIGNLCNSVTITSNAATLVVNETAPPTGSTTQSFCNSGTVANLVATGTSVQWYSVATGGTSLVGTTALVNGNTYYASQTLNGCPSSVRLAVVVTVISSPAPGGSASQALCYGDNLSDIVVTGTNIQWYAAASGGIPLPLLTALVHNTFYYATQTVAGCESTRKQVLVTLSTTAAPTGSATQNFCGSATISNLVVTGTTIQWYTASIGGTPISGTTSIISGTTYYASQTGANGCESTTRLAVTANIFSCENGLNFDGLNDQVGLASTINSSITSAGTFEAWIKTTNAGSGFRALIVRPNYYGLFLNGNQLMSYNWTVNGSVGATTYTVATLNDNQWHHVALTFQESMPNGSQLYLDGQAVGAPFTHFISYVPANFALGANTNTQYYGGLMDRVKIWGRALSAQELNDSYNCINVTSTNLIANYNFNQGFPAQNNAGVTTLTDAAGAADSGTLTGFGLNGTTSNWVNGYSCTPNLCNTPTGPTSQTFCNSATVSNLVANGTNIQWYTAATGGSPLSIGTALVTGSTYYATQTTSCESPGRLAVTVTVNSTSAPIGSASQSFCNSAMVSNLTATGIGILWYTTPTGGTALSVGTALVNGTTYYASQTVSGCQSVSRLAVTVTITSPAAPTGNATQEICTGGNTITVNSLSATGSNIKWYANPSGGTFLASNTPVTNGSTYYASQTINGCESINRLAVTVILHNFTTNVTAPNPQSFCTGATIADLVANITPGAQLNWYTSSMGWSFGTPLPTNTVLTNGTIYYAGQSLGSTNQCVYAGSFGVTVSLNSTSTPTGSAAQTFCNSATVANLTATGTAIQWYTTSTGGTSLTSGTSLTNGTTYYASQTVSGCQSANRLAVVVTINTPSVPSGIATQTFCSGANIGSLSATGTNIQWYAAASGGSPLSPSTLLSNGIIYYASQTVNGCESTGRFAVTAVFGIPSAPTGSAAQTVCNSGTVANLTAVGSNIQWYAAPTGGTPLSAGTALVNGTTYYASQTSGGCESTNRLAVTVTINAPATPTGTGSQTFCNSGTVANLVATGTGIQWYAASTGGTALTSGTTLTSGTAYYASQTISGCESANRFAVTVTINAPATPTGAAAQTFCNSATVANLTATGTGIQWYAASTGGTALSTGTALTNGTTYYASQTISSCQSVNRFAVTATINAPAAPTGTAAQTFCNSGTVANLTATGTGIQWYAASTGGSALATGTTLVNGTTYYASQTISGCESATRFAVTATINSPAAPTGIVAQTFCNSGTVANLVATGTGIQWYAASTGGSALAIGTALVNGTTYYASQTITGCESVNRFAVTATINTPAAPTGTASQTFCNLGTVANLTATGTGIQWYAASTGGTALTTGTVLATGTTYYASQTISGCQSATRLAVAVTVNVTSSPTGSTTQTVCSGAIVGDLSVSGTNIQWYSTASGGSPLLTSTALVNGVTYYASQTISSCESATRLGVTVAFGIPSAPTGSASQTICNSGTVANLATTGSNIQWYTAATGGSPLSIGTALVNGTTYYASQTSGGCESTSRLAVSVTINAPAAPTGTAAQEFCNAATVADFAATGSGIQWYTAATGGSALNSTTPLVNGTYYASQTVSGCESASRFAVAVTMNIPAAPAATANQNFCGSGLVSDIPVSGSNITWYDAASAGNVLTPTTSLVDGSTYYATQTINGCTSLNQLAVTVSINAIPSAPTGTATQEFCNSATIADLAVTGTTVTWYASAGSSSPLTPATALSDGASYFATQTVNGCESTDRLEVAVTINAPATPTGNTTQSFCSAAVVDDLSATGTSIAWYSNATGGTPLAGTAALSNGTYYASQTINGCESANRLAVAVTVTILNANVTQTGITLTATQTGANYTWVDCNNGNQPIAGANGQSFTPTANGSYAVEIELNGCTVISSCVQISSVGLEEDKTLVLGVQPNPTFGVLNISVSYPTSAVITASNGTVVKTLALEGVKTIDVSSFATGVYYIRTSEGQTVKFIKE